MKKEEAPQKTGSPPERLPAGVWARIEKEIKAGRPIKTLLREMEAEGLPVPRPVSVRAMAKRRGWVTEQAQADALVKAVHAGAEIIRAEKDPLSRQKILDKATKQLTLDELFREHGEGVLAEVKIALERLRDRNVSASESAFALQRIMDGLSKLREAMEGKRPAVAVQVNNENRPREVLMVQGVMKPENKEGL